MFGNLKGGYEDLWKAIIRPPREIYEIKDLGPVDFKVKGIRVHRTDIDIKNKAGSILKCSHFEPQNRPCKELPCVVYLHGNSSSRIESLNCLRVLLTQNITLFSLDFAGCGLSEGEYISLGWYERDDVDIIIQHLRNSGTVSTIGIWGRSMGAVTALMHADRDPSIAGLVLDSPFSSLRQLAEDLCKQHSKIPKFVMSGALAMIKSTIQSKAKFDINDLNPLKNHVQKAFIPALFVAGKEDLFISPEHTKALHKAYAGDKNLILVEGDHNSQRPQFMLDSVGIFFYNTLQVQVLVPAENLNDKQAQNQPNLPDIEERMYYGSIGNHDDVAQAFQMVDGADDLFEEEIRKALEESMKLSEPANQNSQKNTNQISDLLSLDNPISNEQNQPQNNQEKVDWFGDDNEKQEEPKQSKNKYPQLPQQKENNSGNINQDFFWGTSPNSNQTNQPQQQQQPIKPIGQQVQPKKEDPNKNSLAEYFEDY